MYGLLREILAWSGAFAFHIAIFLWLAYMWQDPIASSPSPELQLSQLTITIAEDQSDLENTPSTDAPSPQPTSTTEPTPSALSDPLSDLPPLLPEPPQTLPNLPPSELIPVPIAQPQFVPDAIPSLPEITLPPASSAGQTARLEHVAVVTDLSSLMKNYPREARSRHLEGTVTLALDIGEKNQLLDVRILNSSGHLILDRAAVHMFKKVRFTGGPGTIIQPVEYKLK